jgi:hypothetical protein
MKTLKSIIVAGIAASSLTGLAWAGSGVGGNNIEYIHLSGAPAYRQDVIKEINAVVATFPGAGATDAYEKVASGSGGTADFTNATAEQWYIPNFATGEDLVISLSLTGSTAGVESVSSGTATLGQGFLPDTDSTASEIGTGNQVSFTGTTTVTTETVTPDFTFSDTFQSTTPFNGTVQFHFGGSATNSGTKETYTYSTLQTSGPLAVEPYVWVATPGFPVTNVTTEELANLYKNGALPLSYFTGKASDATSTVYGLTRDPGSGSRLVAITELGLSPGQTIKTYEPTVSGASADSLGDYVGGVITGAVSLYPAGPIKSTQINDPNPGDTGYPSFADATNNQLLAAITSIPTVNSSSPSTSEYFITYLNPTDGAEAVANNAVQLTFNGVGYNSSSPANLQNGQYTFWSYEQIFYPSTLSSPAQTILTDLENNWSSVTLSTGVQLSAISVQRDADGTYNGNFIY